MFDKLPPFFRYSISTPENRLRRSRPETNNDRRSNQRNFGLQPRTACGYFRTARFLMEPPFPALLKLEVLDRISHPGRSAIDARFAKSTIHQPAGGSNERPTGTIFFIAWLFSDEHNVRGVWPLTEDRLRGVPVEIAAPAVLYRLPKHGQARSLRNKIDGAFRFQLAHAWFRACNSDAVTTD
jgi:hypothetical protein